MSILVYLLLTVTVCFIASLHIKEQPKKTANIGKGWNEPGQSVQRVSAVKVILISFFLSLYSKILGITGNLVDRVSYAYSFLYRYPDFYHSPGALWKEKTEPAFILLIQVIRRITQDPDWFFFITTFISASISIYVMFKISHRYFAGIALFMLSLYFFQSTYLIRQSLAVAFVNLAILNYLEERRSRYFLFTGIACMFHSTAMIMLPIYIVFRNAKSKRVYQILFLLFAILFLGSGILFGTVIPRLPYVGQYIVLDNFKYALGDGSPAAMIKGVPYYLITLLSFIYRKELRARLKQADLFILSSLLYSMSWLLTYNMYWLFRIGWFLMLPTLILVPELFSVMKNMKERLFYGSIFLLSLLFITFRQLLLELY